MILNNKTKATAHIKEKIQNEMSFRFFSICFQYVIRGKITT